MKVVLVRNVSNVGKAGEVKEVADGFARNFLIPQGLAEMAHAGSIKKAETLIKDAAAKQQQELEQAQKLAQEWEGREIVIKGKAKEGKLFGSINQHQIAKQLEKEGHKLNHQSVILAKPIKELGEYSIKLNLGHGIEADIKVVVEEEK